MRERTRVVWLALLIAVSASSCIDRQRLNSGCDWTGDTAGPLDLARVSDRHHLVADAQLAEGLAVRYADTEHRRRFGYGGHGGLLEHRRVLHDCMDRLVATIERNHGVTAAQIDAARAERSAWFDAAVMLSFGGAYACASLFAAARLRHRFVDAPVLAVAIVIVVAAAAFSLLGVQLGDVWTAVWETVRIGDGHFGTFRAAHAPWGQHLGALFVAGMVLFAAAAAVRWRVDTRREVG